MSQSALYSVFVSFNPDTEAIDVWRSSNGTRSADPLDVRPGRARIQWRPIDGQEDLWEFTDLKGLPTPPFSGKRVERQVIEVEDENLGTPQPPYHYQIEIVANGTPYTPDPQIRNESG